MTAKTVNDSRDILRSSRSLLRVMESFDENSSFGVSELARKLDLPKTTVHRIVTTLKDTGWLSPMPSAPTRWMPSTKFYSLASRLVRGWSLRNIAAPLLRELRDKTLEGITLVVPQDKHVVHVDRVESSLPIQAISSIGSITPIYASSSGKAILSRLPRDEVLARLPQVLEAFTKHTIVSRDELLKDLEKTAKRGYAVSWQEYRLEVIGIGAPIINDSGVPVAAISMLVPSMRMPKDRTKELGPLIADTAASIGRQVIQGQTTLMQRA